MLCSFLKPNLDNKYYSILYSVARNMSLYQAHLGSVMICMLSSGVKYRVFDLRSCQTKDNTNVFAIYLLGTQH